MAVLEEIEAAIAKLTQLRDESTQPTDGNAWIQGRDWRRYENSTEVYTGPDENTPESADIVTFIQPEDAELIVALHRTINPVLDLLREAQADVASRSRLGLPLNTGPVRAIALARAINGVTS